MGNTLVKNFNPLANETLIYTYSATFKYHVQVPCFDITVTNKIPKFLKIWYSNLGTTPAIPRMANPMIIQDPLSLSINKNFVLPKSLTPSYFSSSENRQNFTAPIISWLEKEAKQQQQVIKQKQSYYRFLKLGLIGLIAVIIAGVLCYVSYATWLKLMKNKNFYRWFRRMLIRLKFLKRKMGKQLVKYTYRN